MAIKNTFTKAPALQSVAKVQALLIEHGAVGIQMMYDGEKRISALQFALPYKNGKNIAFALPCEWRKFQQVLKAQQTKRWDDEEYAYRVAWANLRDWVAAQMALYETMIVTMPQIFLPFATDGRGKTLYDSMEDSEYALLLGGGNNQ